MARTWPQTLIGLALITFYFIPTNGQLRADLSKGFKLCPGKQVGRIVSVEVDGPGCYRRNGQAQWPCFLYPGRAGTYRVSFTHNLPNPLTTVKSSIHAIAKYRGFLSRSGVRHIPFFGEVNKNACPAIGCPVRPGSVHIIEKTFKVPGSVRLAEQNMKIEFKLTTGRRKDTIICFIVPAINQ